VSSPPFSFRRKNPIRIIRGNSINNLKCCYPLWFYIRAQLNKFQLIKTMPSPTYKINTRYVLLAVLAVIFSWLIHEAAHYITGSLLGYDMAMTFNTAYPVSGQYAKDWHYQAISAAGPLITIIEALIVFALMRNGRNAMLYTFLFTCFYMRLLAGIISFLNPNDEARISKAIGLGAFTLPVLVIALLFYTLYKTSQQYRFTKKFQLATLGLIILFTSIIVLSDQFFKFRIL
jgi:branched-subunit amino acid transport protein AzlD